MRAWEEDILALARHNSTPLLDHDQQEIVMDCSYIKLPVSWGNLKRFCGFLLSHPPSESPCVQCHWTSTQYWWRIIRYPSNGILRQHKVSSRRGNNCRVELHFERYEGVNGGGGRRDACLFIITFNPPKWTCINWREFEFLEEFEGGEWHESGNDSVPWLLCLMLQGRAEVVIEKEEWYRTCC